MQALISAWTAPGTVDVAVDVVGTPVVGEEALEPPLDCVLELEPDPPQPGSSTPHTSRPASQGNRLEIMFPLRIESTAKFNRLDAHLEVDRLQSDAHRLRLGSGGG